MELFDHSIFSTSIDINISIFCIPGHYNNQYQVTKPELVCKYNNKVNNTSTLYLKWSLKNRSKVINEAISPQFTFVVQYQKRNTTEPFVDIWNTMGSVSFLVLYWYNQTFTKEELLYFYVYHLIKQVVACCLFICLDSF